MPSKRGRGGGGGASTSTSGAASFTPLADLVPASIPFTDQAQETLEVLRAGQDPGIDALLAALNCGGACDAAGAPYSGKCGCCAAVAGVARSLPSSTAAARGGAGGGAAPRCVRGLAPPPGSHRKVGLWAKPPKAEAEAAALEEEEEEVKRRVGESSFFPLLSREVEEKKLKNPKIHFQQILSPPQRAIPVGLFNLGATCYVAGALQCLFADTAFRQGLYESATGGGGGGDEASQQQPPAADASGAAGGGAPASSAPGGDAAVRALRRLFASMQAGPAGCSADPGPLVRALGLDAGEQQDGQEFFKLLLALLEERLHGGDGGPATPPPPPPAAGAAEAPAAPAGLVPSLFRGRSSIETVCGLCQGRASSSDRVEEFTELAVPVRGSDTLEHALASAAAPEYLPGEEFFFPLLSSFLPLLLLFERGSPTLFPPENDKNTPPIQTKRRRRRRGLHPLRPLRERARARHPPRRPPRPPSPPLRLAAAVRLRRGGDGEGESRGQDEFPPDAVGRASAG